MKRLMLASLAIASLAAAAVAPAQEAAPAHRQAAAELLDLMDMENMLDQSIDLMIQSQVEANPQLAVFEDILREFLDRHMQWEDMKSEYVEIYVDAFTRDELAEIAEFYRTETGRKAVSMQAELFRKGAMIGQRRVQENLGELEAMIMERAQEMQDAPAVKQ